MDELIGLFIITILLLLTGYAIYKAETLKQILASFLLIILSTYVITYVY